MKTTTPMRVENEGIFTDIPEIFQFLSLNWVNFFKYRPFSAT